jgi:hypothetical protein
MDDSPGGSICVHLRNPYRYRYRPAVVGEIVQANPQTEIKGMNHRGPQRATEKQPKSQTGFTGFTGLGSQNSKIPAFQHSKS